MTRIISIGNNLPGNEIAWQTVPTVHKCSAEQRPPNGLTGSVCGDTDAGGRYILMQGRFIFENLGDEVELSTIKVYTTVPPVHIRSAEQYSKTSS